MYLNCFGRVQIVLVRSKPFCVGTNHFGYVQIRLFWNDFYDLDPYKTGMLQNNLYLIEPNYLGGPELFCTHRRTRQLTLTYKKDLKNNL